MAKSQKKNLKKITSQKKKYLKKITSPKKNIRKMAVKKNFFFKSTFF